MKFNLNFTTDYGQFYLNDKNGPQNTGSDYFWTDQAFADKIATEDGLLGIAIGNDEGIVKCEIEILDSKSSIIDFTNFDHVVEASIKIKSGIIQVLDCPHSEIELEMKTENGEYRVRVYSLDLKTGYDENPNDSYKIEIWKEPTTERSVLKRYI